MNQTTNMTRLEVVNVETLEVVKTVDMTTRDPLQIQKMSDSLLRNVNTFQFFVRATPSAAPVKAEAELPTHCDPAEGFCLACREKERTHRQIESEQTAVRGA